MQRYFPRTHIEQRRGTKKQARDYCRKAETRIGQTYEFGIFAEERSRTDMKELTQMLDDGVSLAEIRKRFPTQFLMFQKKIEAYQQQVRAEQQEEVYRHLKVYYIHGKTGTGKTRFVIGKHGFKNVYRVTHYDQRAFDMYKGQEVILFDEFRSSFKISDMLHYLDGYPLPLPCRYNDKMACYTIVYVVSNIPLADQYRNVQNQEWETWLAFLRRINCGVYNYDDELYRNALHAGIELESAMITRDMLTQMSIDRVSPALLCFNAQEQERRLIHVEPPDELI